MTNHSLKCWTPSFQAILDGVKMFEFRKNDRNYKIGDYLVLNEWNPSTDYTGRVDIVKVTWILYEGFGLPDGYCIMSISREFNKNKLRALKDEIDLWRIEAHQDAQALEEAFEYTSSDILKGKEQAYQRVMDKLQQLIDGDKNGI